MKRIIAILTALVLLAGAGFLTVMPVSAADGDEIRASRKIISVVYDDSGSMFGDRWVYANYAMQALTALLNEQDILYITYMSRPDTAMRIELSDLDKAVRNIRSWMHSNDTPIASLNTAFQALKNTDESDPTTQFWCVAMTDGDFNDMTGTIQDNLNAIKGTVMSNGSTINLAYLAMGPGAIAASSDQRGGLYAYSAEDADRISTTMADIANLISGRISADNIKQVDERTISFHSELPLYSISVLSQQSSVSVTSANSAEAALHIDRNIGLHAFEPYDNCDTKLYGNAAVISGSGKVIQPGKYTITFSEAVDVDSLLVQYEPAIGMKLLVERDGSQIDDTSRLNIGDKVSVRMIPVNPGTGDLIDEGDLPAGLSWKIEYIVGGTEVDQADKDTLRGLRLQEGENTIRGTMQIPGFAPSVYEVHFGLYPIVYHFGIQVDQPDPLTYLRKSSSSGSQEGSSLVFRITNDGVPLSAEEQDSIKVRLETSDVSCDDSAVEGFFNRFGSYPAKCDLRRNDDGSYTLVPLLRAPFTAFLMKAGVYTVTVAVDQDPAVTAQGTFTMVAKASDWFDLLGLLLTIFLLCCMVYVAFFKHKFNNQTVHYEVYKLSANGRGSLVASSSNTYLLKRFCLNMLWPFKRSTEAVICGLTFQAGSGGSVIITGKSIARTAYRYGPSTSNPTISLRSIVTSLRPTRKLVGKKETVVATDQSISSRPVYFQSRQGDTMIWRIWITD